MKKRRSIAHIEGDAEGLRFSEIFYHKSFRPLAQRTPCWPHGSQTFAPCFLISYTNFWCQDTRMRASLMITTRQNEVKGDRKLLVPLYQWNS